MINTGKERFWQNHQRRDTTYQKMAYIGKFTLSYLLEIKLNLWFNYRDMRNMPNCSVKGCMVYAGNIKGS